MTRLLPAIIALSWMAVMACAQEWPWKTEDFEPLTSLPWTSKEDAIKPVLSRIFREPRLAVRLAVLEDYLRQVPAEKFEEAFDLCLKYEGMQRPEELVDLLLRHWAAKDPRAAWKKTQELMQVLLIQGAPLDLDRWQNPRIAVTDVKGIRASPFYLDGLGLSGFADGVALASSSSDPPSLSRAETIALLQLFSKRFIDLFAVLPAMARRDEEVQQRQRSEIIRLLTCEFNDVTWVADGQAADPVQLDVAAIRWLKQEPWRVEHLLKRTTGEPSLWFLQMWKRLDLKAMKAWAEEAPATSDSRVQARGMLLGDVDAATRDRWFAEERKADPERPYESPLLRAWSIWDPKGALQYMATLKPEDPANGRTAEECLDDLKSNIGSALHAMVYMEDQMVWNRGAYGRQLLSDQDWTQLPATMIRAVIEAPGITMMEQWSDADVGQAARFSFQLITSEAAQDIFPRAEMIKEFAGGAPFSRDDFNDRCFCCLRFWAMWKPEEMKAWIATVKGEDMRKALSWLLEHPWGSGPGPE